MSCPFPRVVALPVQFLLHRLCPRAGTVLQNFFLPVLWSRPRYSHSASCLPIRLPRRVCFDKISSSVIGSVLIARPLIFEFQAHLPSYLSIPGQLAEEEPRRNSKIAYRSAREAQRSPVAKGIHKHARFFEVYPRKDGRSLG